jgi:cob(I)alamin adenosyltransferase
MKDEPGYIIVLTGNGKGKTTAALGMALRAVGHGLRVLMLQFIKGSKNYGELAAVERLAGTFEIVQMGRGSFVHVDPASPDPADVAAAEEAWVFAREQVLSGVYDMIILDEINNAVDYGLLEVSRILEVLKEKPDRITLVLTGRGADPAIIEIADLVTEMGEVKHPFRKGKKARKGIEF